MNKKKSLDAEMAANERIFVGWKEIMASFGVRSKKTMKRKIRKHGVPILNVARKPTISAGEVEQWRESRKNP